MFEPPNALYRRPRLLNPLHALGIFKAHSQTNTMELECLARYAKGHEVALEIGSYMGVSARVIARELAPGGKLYCVDPWEIHHGRENPCWTICKRELRRNTLLDRVEFLHGFSYEMESAMPVGCDFIFVDGDHTYEGLERDWAIVMRRLSPGGILCLHDTTVPEAEPYRQFGTVKFFDEVIRHHPELEWLECCYSMNVLRRRIVTDA
ncbi:MAG TPA: class I SAM-dependent methyltransferase [Pyrinomonadaceae bacterium]|jgi:predicted O-methyltransferase YrrM